MATLFDHEQNGSHFTCPCCGRISYNPNDVRHAYCGYCHWFSQDGYACQMHLRSARPARPNIWIVASIMAGVGLISGLLFGWHALIATAPLSFLVGCLAGRRNCR